jgi:hypothetical protein
LRRLREGLSFDIGLWIDALCIDQDSNEEKNHQLRKMLMIYHSGANTCIWLGESTGGSESERGMKFVEDIVSIGYLRHLLEDPERVRDWLAFAELLTRDWFSRRWIIQEVAASRFATIRFGGVEIKWGDFVEAIEIFFRSFEEIQKMCWTDPEVYVTLDMLRRESLPAKALVETTLNVFRHWEGSVLQSRWSLERLVMKLNRFLVTDSRDTIYAIIGIANDNVRKFGGPIGADEQILVGDYKKKTLEVYIDFFRYAVSKSGSLDIILRRWASPITIWSGSAESEGGALPSWIGVVDASRIERSFIGEPGKCTYKACSDTVAECSFGLTNNVYDGTITANGIILGAVETTSGLIVSLDDVLKILDQLEYPVSDREKVAGVLWRTLVGDRDSNGGNPPRWYQRACLYWLTHASSELELVAAFQKRVEEVVSDRKLFTYKGVDESFQLGGIGPSGIQSGDLVCILFGCSVPVILREHTSNDYILIGECYVHRKMEGEHFFDRDLGSIKKQSFTIR